MPSHELYNQPRSEDKDKQERGLQRERERELQQAKDGSRNRSQSPGDGMTAEELAMRRKLGIVGGSNENKDLTKLRLQYAKWRTMGMEKVRLVKQREEAQA